MKNEKKNILSTFKYKLALIIAITIIISGATTYGFFYSGKSQGGTSSLETSCFDVTFGNEGSSINLTNAIAMKDNYGMKTDPYTFTLTNNCENEVTYYVIVSTKDGSFSNDFINISLNDEPISTLSLNKRNRVVAVDTGYNNSYVISTGSLSQGTPKDFEFRAWLNTDASYEDVRGKTWEAQVRVVSSVKELEDLKENLRSASEKTLYSLGQVAKETTDTVPNFAEPAVTDEGIYSMEDDYGTSYFYRGAVTNNYVKFGKWTEGTPNAGKDMYWRIIRINGDGSLRIRYDGTQAYANGTNSADRFTHTEQAYNTNYNDAKYVGWMYGPAGTGASGSKAEAQTNTSDSDIKKVVDAWYKTNIVDNNLSQYVADAIFCNDRSTPGSVATGWSSDTGLGYGTNATAYGATPRVGWPWKIDKTRPNFVCPNKNDAFTVIDTSKGNGALTYPVGLITADEIVAAGSGKYNTGNSSYYLYNPNAFSSSISPSIFNGNYSYVFKINTSGNLEDGNSVSTSGAISPVINLSAEYAQTLQGDGTLSNPFYGKA